jgi:hypothetical protein
MNKVSKLLSGSLLIAMGILPGDASAETLDFGGRTEMFKGRGDRIPPTCQVSAPNSAGAPFLVLWNCADEGTAQPELRSEIWVLRNGSTAWDHLKTFLGFPAGLEILPEHLLSPTVKEGLPASFRVVGIDRAGNTTFSPVLTVNPGDSGNLSCTISINTEGTETDETGSTTGVPAQSVVISSAATEAISSSASAFSFKSAAPTLASPCEIDALCAESEELSFAGSGTVAGTASIELTVGSVSASLAGSVRQSGSVISAIQATGSTTVEESLATIELNCSSNGSGA